MNRYFVYSFIQVVQDTKMKKNKTKALVMVTKEFPKLTRGWSLVGALNAFY